MAEWIMVPNHKPSHLSPPLVSYKSPLLQKTTTIDQLQHIIIYLFNFNIKKDQKKEQLTINN